MRRTSIAEINNSYFSSLWEIYETAFPLSERRTLEDQIRVFSNKTYYLEAWIEDDTVVGLIGWWMCGNLRFVEHYAIHPNYRSSGYGSRFLKEWMDANDIPVLLEIEPVEDKITQRRQNFYRRLGFKDNDIQHFQPPYHKGMKRLPLWLMSYPSTISQKDYEKFYLKQSTEIILPMHDSL